MKNKKYLPLYYKWMVNGRLPGDGLCSSLGYDIMFMELLSPDDPDSNKCAAYWGFMGEDRTEEYNTLNLSDVAYGFTPLRQNIVLLLAALNGEL